LYDFIKLSPVAKVGQDGILSHDQIGSFQGVSAAEMKDSSNSFDQDSLAVYSRGHYILNPSG
jgi:hypothetical protein